MSNSQHPKNSSPTNGHLDGALATPLKGALNPATPQGSDAQPQVDWSVSETLSGRTMLVSGTTGFLGKVFLSMLLRYHPDVEHIYALVRSRPDRSAEERFYQNVVNNSVMEPLREIYGAGYLDFIKEKCTPLTGDITEEHLGLGEEKAREISSKIDVFINSAGLTNFNPNLESALTINTLSQFHMLDFLKLGGGRASFMHVSTCFVAGNRNGKVPEVMPGPDFYPNHAKLGVPYDHRREIEDCNALIAHAKHLAQDQGHQVQFERDAREALRQKNLDPNSAKLLQKEVKKIRDKWLRKRLQTEGRQRAEFWGWPNIYTYTKSLGERLLADVKDEVNLTIFRPAIIESSMNYPVEGWNEGINTSAPLAFLMSKGHRYVPTRQGVNLDIVPVDYVAGAMVAVSAALIQKRQHDVYHCGSGDLNPMAVSRTIELTNLGLRKLNRGKKMPVLKKLALNSLDSVPVEADKFRRRSAPGLKKTVGGLRGLLNRVPTQHLGGFGKALSSVDKGLKAAEALTGVTEMIFEMMIPFTHDNAFCFQTKNIPALVEGLPAPERERYGSPVQNICWRHYWMDVHMPGLAKYSFPELEEKFSSSNKKSYTYDDLLELFDSSTENFAERVALQHHAGGITEQVTYRELKRAAERAAQTLKRLGAQPNSAVLIASENRPQWGMSYFGVLKAGCVAVPVDQESSAAELSNLISSCGARVIIMSEAVRARVGEELGELLEDSGRSARFLGFDELFAAPIEQLAADGGAPLRADERLPALASDEAAMSDLARAAADGSPLASLIYTSGTTGTPKGVMLTHQNFTNLLTGLHGTFNINERDGFLSVLPLHHTFEFACGFLMPLSRGSTITYLDELTGEELTSAMQSTRITALIGVPALWQLLHRRVRQRIDDAPPAVRWALDFVLSVNNTLRDRYRVNIGPSVFGAVHKAFGGRLKYLISGGAALPSDVLEAFHGMGFNLYEGYGLTEAAPVLTVNGPKDGLNPGSVGQALPGIEVKILNPDDEGVGEVIARAKSVMRGYLDLPEDTERALQGGWLHTGDLGKLDKRGRLKIVGRAKEVIITSGGKNVYPDELEDAYDGCEDIEEFSIVGLPDGSGSERVACLARARFQEGPSPSAEERSAAEQRIREHFRVEGARMAAHNRISVLRFTREELPRTATRKIKRSAVIEILESKLSEAKSAAAELRDPLSDSQFSWLHRQIAILADVDAEDVHSGTHFADELGFDSLMVAELSSVLAERDYSISTDRLTQVQTVRDLEALLAGNLNPTELARHTPAAEEERVEEFQIPAPLANLSKELLRRGQKRAYDDFFDVEVYGRAHIPYHDPNIIVVANHSSHLDMGLIKYALGDFGKDIRALAAEDYFFNDPVRKTYFSQLTNLIPVTRSGNLEGSLVHADEALNRGEMLLIFPEGTRSKDGKLQRFRRGMGYLAASHKVDILPIYLNGTHRALPKGKSIPSLASRKLKVYIGEPLSTRDLLRECADEPNIERYRYVSAAAHSAIAKMRDAANRRPGEEGEDLSGLFSDLNDKFGPNRLSEELSFYFSLGSAEKLKWTIIVDADACQIGMGKPAGGRADCVIKTSPDIFKKIVTESYIPSMDEFMSGKIKTNAPHLLAQFKTAFAL